MIRKIKLVISIFVLLLVLSVDLGTFFTPAEERQAVACETENSKEENAMFSVKNLKRNLSCISGSVLAIFEKNGKNTMTDFAKKYDEALNHLEKKDETTPEERTKDKKEAKVSKAISVKAQTDTVTKR